MKKEKSAKKRGFISDAHEKFKQELSRAKDVADLKRIKKEWHVRLGDPIGGMTDYSGLFFNTVADFYLAGKMSDEDFGELIASTAIAPEYFSRALKEIRMLKKEMGRET